MTTDASRKVPLFGGAISAHLPTRYVDVSDFRPVPDNQEVWTDASVDESVIVEILERVEEGPSDAEGGAAGWFWEDLAAVSECGPIDVHLTSVTRLSSEHLPAMNGRFAAASVAVSLLLVLFGTAGGVTYGVVAAAPALARLEQSQRQAERQRMLRERSFRGTPGSRRAYQDAHLD